MEESAPVGPPRGTFGVNTPTEAGHVPRPRTAAVALPHRHEMEQAFGTSFGEVAVHVGEQASLAPFGARAAAWPETVLFASRNPERAIVAHELAHVEQLRRWGNVAQDTYSRPGDPAEREAQGIAATTGVGSAAVRATVRPTGVVSFDRDGASSRSEALLDEQELRRQARNRNTDTEIPALEFQLQSVRKEAFRKGLLSKAAFEASVALSKAMTQLQPAIAADAPVDVVVQVQAAIAAQQLFMALQRETADDKNFHAVSTTGPHTASGVIAQNPYTEELRLTTSFFLWSSTHESAGSLQQLPNLIHQGKWGAALDAYRRLMIGLDLWIADQLRKHGKGGTDENLGNVHQSNSELRAGLEQIARKHATRLPALFHPTEKTPEDDEAANAFSLNIYFWKGENDKYHLYDLTAPRQPHEQIIDGPPTAASMNTFFEEVLRYPDGQVRYTLPDGTGGVARTTGKTKWYEWAAKAGLLLAGAGLALTGIGLIVAGAGISVAATVCLAGGTLAGGIVAGAHLFDSLRLGTATTTTVVIDVAQLASSFASLGAMGLTVRAGSAAAALAGCRYFVPLLGASAVADSVQVVALTDVALAEMEKVQLGFGEAKDKERAMSVLAAQLLVTGGLTVLSVRGAYNAAALRGSALEIIDQNGAKVLRPVGEGMADVVSARPITQDPILATPAKQDSIPPPSTQAAKSSETPELSPRVRDMEAEMERELAKKVQRKEQKRENERETERLARVQRLYDELVGQNTSTPSSFAHEPTAPHAASTNGVTRYRVATGPLRPDEERLGIGDEYSAYFGGPKDPAGLHAELMDGGVLSLYIKVGPNTPRGGQMFNEALEAFGSNVKRIRGSWYSSTDISDNFDSYKKGIKAGLTPEEAAAGTFTGKMSKRAGFTKVTIIVDTAWRVEVEFSP